VIYTALSLAFTHAASQLDHTTYSHDDITVESDNMSDTIETDGKVAETGAYGEKKVHAAGTSDGEGDYGNLDIVDGRAHGHVHNHPGPHHSHF
jgi:hypothetical protein